MCQRRLSECVYSAATTWRTDKLVADIAVRGRSSSSLLAPGQPGQPVHPSVCPPARRYEYRRSRDAACFNTDVIRRRVNRKRALRARAGRRCMTSRRAGSRSSSRILAAPDRCLRRRRRCRLVRFVSVAVDARRKHLARRVSFSGARSSIERGRACGPTHAARRRPAGPSASRPRSQRRRRRRLSDSALSNRPYADRYAAAAGAKDAPAARKIRHFRPFPDGGGGVPFLRDAHHPTVPIVRICPSRSSKLSSETSAPACVSFHYRLSLHKFSANGRRTIATLSGSCIDSRPSLFVFARFRLLGSDWLSPGCVKTTENARYVYTHKIRHRVGNKMSSAFTAEYYVISFNNFIRYLV